MYARIVIFTLEVDRPKIEAIGDGIYRITKQLKGFKNIALIINDVERKYGAITYWESEESAVAAAPILNSFMQEQAGNYIKEPPYIAGFEVYEPKE